MIDASSFFAAISENDARRSGSGNPLIVLPTHEGRDDPMRVEYSRASGLADNVENKDHIHKWEMRYLAKALGQNEDLAALAAVETYSTGVETDWFTPEQRHEKSASGRRLDDIIKRALDRARLHEKADRGTAVHGATEPDAPGLHLIPERLRHPVAAFAEVNRRECIEIVGTEVFTVNDTLASAGTFDHLVRVHGHPDLTGLVIADKKTGRFDPLSWVIQLASYAYGKIYDTALERRREWPGEINPDYGLVWQIDCKQTPEGRTDPGVERIQLWVIDLRVGWDLAQMAARIRDAHKDVKSLAGDFRSPTFEQRFAACSTPEALRALWSSLDDGDPRRADIEKKARAL